MLTVWMGSSIPLLVQSVSASPCQLLSASLSASLSHSIQRSKQYIQVLRK